MTWVRIDDEFPQHPKVVRAGPLGMALQVAGLCYCNKYLTDGFIPWAVAKTLLNWEFLDDPDPDGTILVMSITVSGQAPAQAPAQAQSKHVLKQNSTGMTDYVIGLLKKAGVWEEIPGGFLVHDYEDYQPSKAQVEAEKQAKVAAGQAGGQASAQARAQAKVKQNLKQNSTPIPNPIPNPIPKPKPKTTPLPSPHAAAVSQSLTQFSDLTQKAIALYEQTISPITAKVAELISDFMDNSFKGEPAWLDLAFQEAAKNQARSWAYVEAILKSWQSQGGPKVQDYPKSVSKERQPGQSYADWLKAGM